MKAKNILLTHFSQRVPKFLKVPVRVDGEGHVGVATDLMMIPMKYFHRLPALNSTDLSAYFGQEDCVGAQEGEDWK
jgi:hypothetical protein